MSWVDDYKPQQPNIEKTDSTITKLKKIYEVDYQNNCFRHEKKTRNRNNSRFRSRV